MGVVYEAFDEERRTKVALKTLARFDSTALARFKHEFRAAADLQHPNLVSLGELFCEDGQWFFTMELVEGGDILGHVRPATGLDEARLRTAIGQLASALDALHARGIVHRDVKPANVRVTPEGRVVLLDFGLAEEFGVPDGQQTAGRLAGTPAYMAPEQAASSAVGPPADWYAVGVLLHEALTGSLPFEGTPLEIMMSKQQDGPAPSARATGVPRDLDALCAQLLRFDPLLRATGAQLLAVTGAGTTRPALSSWPAEALPPFVGREAELASLRAAFEASRSRTVTVLVEGESGVGKSDLVRAFVKRLAVEEKGLVVLAGRCFQREAVPYKAFDGVVDALTRFLVREGPKGAALVPTRPGPLAQVFPVLRRVESFAGTVARPALDAIELRSRAFEALRETFARIAGKRALVVTIDDLQWADADSLSLLAELVRPPAGPEMLLLGTTRALSLETGVNARAADVARHLGSLPGDRRHLVVAPLQHDDACELAGRLLERVAGPRRWKSDDEKKRIAATIAREAAGHPFFIDVLSRDEELVAGVSTRDTAAGRLHEVLWSAIQALEPVARSIMDNLAVAAAPLTREVLAAATQTPTEAVSRHVGQLRTARLVADGVSGGEDAVEPYHDRVRAAVLARLDKRQRAERHRAIATALEVTASRDVEALLAHWRGAGDELRVARYAVLAGDAAAEALAFDRAVARYETALDLTTGPDDVRRSLSVKLAEALANAGQGEKAAGMFEAAAVGENRAKALDLQCRAATELLRCGRFDEGTRAVGKVLAEVGLRMPGSPVTVFLLLVFWRTVNVLRGFRAADRETSEISQHELTRVDVCWSIVAQLTFADVTLGTLFQQRHVHLALQCGEPSRVARALAAEVVTSSTLGNRAWPRTQSLIARTSALAESTGDPGAAALARSTVGIATYLGATDFARSLSLCDEAARACLECPGMSWEAAVVQFYTLYALAYLGRWGELGVRIDRMLASARPRADLFTVVNCTTGVASYAWLARDEPTALRRAVESAMHAYDPRTFRLERYYEALSLTFADLYEGHAAPAVERIERIWQTMRRSFYLRVQVLRIEANEARGRAMLALAGTKPDGQERRALAKRVRRVVRAIRGQGTAWGDALATLLEAGCARIDGSAPKAARLFEDAAARCDAAGMALHACVARHARGVALGTAEGHAMAGTASAWMRANGIANPDRVVTLLAPTACLGSDAPLEGQAAPA